MCALGDFAPSVSDVLERLLYKCRFQEQESETFPFSAKEIQVIRIDRGISISFLAFRNYLKILVGFFNTE